MLPSLRSPSVLRRHSLPLLMLCVVQGCERFAFWAMLPLFVLYLHHRHGVSEPLALLALGLFHALSCVGGLPAGWLVDKKLGAVSATLLGAVLLALGYGGLALDHPALLWPALGLMVLGHSLFKPSLHVLIGYVSGETEKQRERGFLWHYLAANIGCLVGPTFAEWAHTRHGWSMSFGWAAASSFAGVGALMLSRRWLLGEGGHHASKQPGPRTGAAQGSMQAVWLICGVAVVFWLTVQQAGSSLMLFAAENTVLQLNALNRTIAIGPGHFSSLHALLVLLLLPVFLSLNGRRRASPPTSTVSKMVWGYVITAAAFLVLTSAGLSGADSGRVSPVWLAGCYALLSLAEMLLAPLGVSLLTLLAPKGRTAQAVGMWFAATAAGNTLAGALGLLWGRWPHHRYFALQALLSLSAALVLLARMRGLDQLIAPASPAGETPALTPQPRRVGIWLASFAILLPVPWMAIERLTLAVRAGSAILCGVAILLCGSYLVARAIESARLSSFLKGV